MDAPIDDPPRGGGPDGEFDTGVFAADIDPAHPVPADTPWGTVALYALEGEVRAFEAFCPHMLGPLFAGSIADGVVTCPWHAWRYSLDDGTRVDDERPAEGPEARPLKRFGVRTSPRGTVVVLERPGDAGP